MKKEKVGSPERKGSAGKKDQLTERSYALLRAYFNTAIMAFALLSHGQAEAFGKSAFLDAAKYQKAAVAMGFIHKSQRCIKKKELKIIKEILRDDIKYAEAFKGTKYGSGPFIQVILALKPVLKELTDF